MATADCETCAMLGHRACDMCGIPICETDAENLGTLIRDAFGRELCPDCA